MNEKTFGDRRPDWDGAVGMGPHGWENRAARTRSGGWGNRAAVTKPGGWENVAAGVGPGGWENRAAGTKTGGWGNWSAGAVRGGWDGTRRLGKQGLCGWLKRKLKLNLDCAAEGN